MSARERSSDPRWWSAAEDAGSGAAAAYVGTRGCSRDLVGAPADGREKAVAQHCTAPLFILLLIAAVLSRALSVLPSA